MMEHSGLKILSIDCSSEGCLGRKVYFGWNLGFRGIQLVLDSEAQIMSFGMFYILHFYAFTLRVVSILVVKE
ncbi:hypothetical protein CR513_49415, partial [Mucuna pruriens]